MASNFKHFRVDAGPNDTIEVSCEGSFYAANVLLLDAANHRAFSRDESCHADDSGYFSRFPIHLKAPRHDRWHVLVDVGEADPRIEVGVALGLPPREIVGSFLRKSFGEAPKASLWKRLWGMESQQQTMGEFRLEDDPILSRAFSKHRIFRVIVGDTYLATEERPGQSTSGVFAYDGRDVHYLSDCPSTLQMVLHAEGKLRGRPKELSFVFVEVIPGTHRATMVLESINDLVDLETSGMYRLHRGELTRYRDRIVRPSLVEHNHYRVGPRWVLRCTTVSLPDHAPGGTVANREFKVSSKDFNVEATEEILSSAAFSRVEIP